MRRKLNYLLASATALLLFTGIAFVPAVVRADDRGFFAGADAGAVFRFGSSHTTHGGASFGGGATVHNVDFDTAYQLGGHAGYRFSSNLAVFVSYNYIGGDVSWQASFAGDSPDGHFDGNAISHVAMANITYTPWTSDATALNITLGVGASVNQLQSVKESYPAQEFHLSDGTKVSPAARVEIGIRHQLASWLELGANAAVTYYGGFQTGNERTGVIPGKTPIGRYGIDPAWGVSVAGAIRMTF